MKFKSIFAIALLSISAFAVTSCNNEGDTTAPVIKLQEPEGKEEFKSGTEICVEFDLSDDVALGSFKINVHNAFNGHDHSTKHGDEGDNFNTDTENAFAYNKTSEELGIDITGLRNSHQHIHLEVPAEVSYGDYHLMIYCYDEAKNESYVACSFALTEDAEEHHHE